jgi:TPP-dependent pyruvate/acetoin dehydrogenase alpha subunit
MGRQTGRDSSLIAYASLRKEDWITSTHRGHGHALAKGLPARKLMAELYGKAAGCCGGRGGSMHLFDPAVGLFGTNGIVAGGLPAAVGAAISAKAHGQHHVVVAFFGDGANTPMKRYGRIDELKGAIVFLASEASSSATGSVPNIDGGFTIW